MAPEVLAGPWVVPILHTLKSEHVSGVKNGAERAENRVNRSRPMSGRCRKRLSGSGGRSGKSWSGSEADSGLNRAVVVH